MFPEMADVHLWCSLIENWPAKSSIACVWAFGEPAFSTISTITTHTHLVHGNYSTFSLSLQHNLKPTHCAQSQRIQNMQPGYKHSHARAHTHKPQKNKHFLPSAMMHTWWYTWWYTLKKVTLKDIFRHTSFWIEFWELRVKANCWALHPKQLKICPYKWMSCIKGLN